MHAGYRGNTDITVVGRRTLGTQSLLQASIKRKGNTHQEKSTEESGILAGHREPGQPPQEVKVCGRHKGDKNKCEAAEPTGRAGPTKARPPAPPLPPGLCRIRAQRTRKASQEGFSPTFITKACEGMLRPGACLSQARREDSAESKRNEGRASQRRIAATENVGSGPQRKTSPV